MFEVWRKHSLMEDEGRDQFEQSFEKKAQALAWIVEQKGYFSPSSYFIKPDELEKLKGNRRSILRKMATRERRVTELRAEIRELDRQAQLLKMQIERIPA